MFERLRRRLTLLCTAATGVILTAMALACLLLSQSLLTRTAEAAFRRDVNAILYYFLNQSNTPSYTLDLSWLSQTENSGGLVLHVELSGVPLHYPGTLDSGLRAELVAQAKGIALADHGLSLDAPPDAPPPSGGGASFRLDGPDGLTYRVSLSSVPAETGWVGLIILKSTAQEQAELNTQLFFFALFALIALLLLALFAWSFTRRALRPIEESRKKQTEFVAAASHELRSPLTVIHASLSALPTASGEEAARYVELADGECMRMSRLVGDLLALANADNGSWSVRRGEAELETLVLDVCEGFEGVAREKGVRLSPVLPQEPLPRCLCDRERIRQMLAILTDNALSYTPAGGTVSVAAALERGSFRLSVTDTGPGVPDEDKARVFERFYRCDASRTSREHYGLGLCIAKEIASLHRGTLLVSDRPGGGAVFTLTLPYEG